MALTPFKPPIRSPIRSPARPGALGHWLAGRRTQRCLLAGLVVVAALAALDLWHWQGLRRLNIAIGLAASSTAPASVVRARLASAGGATPSTAGGATPSTASGAPPATPADDSTAPALRFAQAHALTTQGQTDAALRRYAPLLTDPLLGPAARFNTANLLLRQGQALQAGSQAGQALALIELAKAHYRSLLRNDPAHWPARYNLERAQRLVADPDGVDEPPGAPASPAERSATTMRAHSPGLP